MGATNFLVKDHENAILPSPPLICTMDIPVTHVVIPPTPDITTNYTERERAFSDPQIPLSRPSPPPPSPSAIIPNNEAYDPLSHHWRQSPRRSSSLLRRLSRSSHRRSGSVPVDLRRTVSDPPPASPRKEDDEDMVHVPEQFQRGVEMLRVSRKKVSKRICWIDPLTACVGWDSKNSSKCTLLIVRPC